MGDMSNLDEEDRDKLHRFMSLPGVSMYVGTLLRLRECGHILSYDAGKQLSVSMTEIIRAIELFNMEFIEAFNESKKKDKSLED